MSLYTNNKTNNLNNNTNNYNGSSDNSGLMGNNDLLMRGMQTATTNNFQLLNDDSSNLQLFGSMMNLNLNGFFLPNNCSQTSGSNRLNLVSRGSGDILATYPNESITTRSSPMQSFCEISSPNSSNNSKNLHLNETASSSGANYSSNADSISLEPSENDEASKHVTKLFVGNLPTSTTLQELLAVFKKFGPVNEKLSVVKDQNYAFIHFYNRNDAQLALQEVNDSLFKDRYIRVQFSTSQGYTFNKYKSICFSKLKKKVLL
jgi:hypothetical protein